MKRKNLESHCKSDKIKWIFTVVAFVFVIIMLAGLFLFVIGNGKKIHLEESVSTEKTWVDGAAFEVTTSNSSSDIIITSYLPKNTIAPYGVELAENERLLVVSMENDSAINWFIDFTGEVVYWAADDLSASNCVEITEITNCIYKVACLQPFGQQIKLTATFTDSADSFGTCLCDYYQCYNFDLRIGNISFRGDGLYGNSNKNAANLTFSLNTDSQVLDYSVVYEFSSYTKAAKNEKLLENVEGLSFEFKVIDSWVTEFGFESYKFKSYSVNFETLLSGTIDGFFDITWFEYGVSGNGKTIDDFARALISAKTTFNSSSFNVSDSQQVGIDYTPAYILTINGLPVGNKSVTYNVYLDIYNLLNYVEGLNVQRQN